MLPIDVQVQTSKKEQPFFFVDVFDSIYSRSAIGVTLSTRPGEMCLCC